VPRRAEKNSTYRAALGEQPGVGRFHAAALSSLSAPRATILIASTKGATSARRRLVAAALPARDPAAVPFNRGSGRLTLSADGGDANQDSADACAASACAHANESAVRLLIRRGRAGDDRRGHAGARARSLHENVRAHAVRRDVAKAPAPSATPQKPA
jgi:hypothetical protein